MCRFDSALEEIVSLILLCSDLDSQCFDSLQKGGAISKVLSAPAIAAHISATNAIIVKAIIQVMVCDHHIVNGARSDEILCRPRHRTHLYKRLFDGESKVCSPFHLLRPSLILVARCTVKVACGRCRICQCNKEPVFRDYEDRNPGVHYRINQSP